LYDWNPVLDADGGNGPLDRDHDKASGEPIHDHEGDGFNRVFFVIAPVDSQEVRGLSFRKPHWPDTIECSPKPPILSGTNTASSAQITQFP